MRTISLAQPKGGTGKSTMAVHLASGLAKRGRRTLLVDMDDHGSATRWLLGEAPQGARGAYDALLGASLKQDDLLPAPGREGLWLLPSTPAIARASIELAAEAGGETLLRESLGRLRPRFDVAVLDCPGAMGVVVLAALVASDAVVVPVLSDFLALSGLRKLDGELERLRKRLRAKVQLLGYVHFRVDDRNAIAEEARELLQATGKLLGAEVRTSVAAAALPGRQKTAWDKGADPRGAEDYAALLKAVVARLDGLKGRAA